VALVTGAARNIGQAVATTFAAEGAQLAIATASDRARLCRTAELCRGCGVDVVEVYGDVASPADCQQMVDQTLERFGRIDVLVNTVAIRPGVRFADLTWDMWRRVLDVNLGGTFNFAKLIVPGMIERKSGSIIAFGGLNAMTSGGAGPNSAAKMGLLGFVRSLAIDLAPHNVRVNMVVPGRIATEGRDNIPEDIPMRRRGTTQEIALTTLFLACDDSAYVTGERIMVTGGRTNL
jgi:NAD(P)-dependent dehydrogenase (short-subunit alcohol dehydrogenase family)